jgi:hypothetical protein
MVIPDGSRVVSAELLARETGCDATRELAASNAARLEHACIKWGLAGNKSREGFLTGSDFNDYLIADLISSDLKKYLLFDRQLERFFRYFESEGIWKMVKDRDARSIIAAALAQLVMMPGFESLSVVFPSERRLRGLTEVAKGTLGEDYPFSDNPFFPPDTVSFPIANGIVTADFRTAEVVFREGFRAEDRSLYRAPIQYEEGAEPWPKFWVEKMLLPAMQDEETVRAFFRELAWVILGGARQPMILVIVGVGGTGKGEFIRFVQDLLGPSRFSCKSVSGLDRPFGMASIAQKQVLIFQEESGMFQNGKAKLCKNLTGDDAIDERLVYSGEDVTISGRKIIITTSNDIPYISLNDDVEAWDRRLRPYYWHDYERSEVIPNFRRIVFGKEGPQLLACIMGEMRSLMQYWLNYQKPPLCASSAALRNKILLSSCPIADYLNSRLIREKKKNVVSSELFNNFNDWMRSQGQRVFRSTDFRKTALKLMLQVHGVSESHSLGDGCGRGFRGVRWKSPAEIGETD